ncbi:hypothetical protein [Pseudodesulfovibrio sediminis]|uniref:Glycine-zipper-containing OmpA-like membrane domain-containing protein n=1 Tax=Pseudodesulfovibrio sediminis TaxID=2810563 RepID=A0ABM7P918_9BACT|nr:hypothetical protein [Pseudodesulfovibrio sediminis]BCS89532.1 hypothetical protein PSDVSF_27740 [Pseudodesulfovibrio sediminis]
MKELRPLLLLALIGLVLMAAGCGKKRPVLYPNAHLESVGMQVAQADIDACILKAEEAGAAAIDGNEAAGKVATSAGIAAAAGAVFAAIIGNDVGRTAAAAGGAAAAGQTVSEAVNSGDPAAIHKQFVDRCLRDKGYDVIGWK